MQEMIELAKRRNDESGIMLFLWILIGVKQGAKKVSLRSMAVLSSRAQDRRSREKNKNRLPGFAFRPNLLAVSLPSPAFIA